MEILGAHSEKKSLVLGKQIAFMIDSYFKICDIQGTVVDLNELLCVGLKRHNLRAVVALHEEEKSRKVHKN